MTNKKDLPDQEDQASTQGVPALDSLLKQDRAGHMPEGEDEATAAKTEAIDFQALLASGVLGDLGGTPREEPATTPLRDKPSPMRAMAPPEAPAAPAAPAPAPPPAAPQAQAPPPEDSWSMGAGNGGGSGGGGGDDAMPEKKGSKNLIIGLVVGALMLFCCCPGALVGGGFGYTYFVSTDRAVFEDIPSVKESGSDDSGGGGTSLTADDISAALKAEGYSILGDPTEVDAGGTKSVTVVGTKGATVATVLVSSYGGPGADIAIQTWQDGVKDVPGTSLKVDGNIGIMVTVSNDKDEAERLLKIITGG